MRRQPTRRRGSSSYVVDYANLADMILRRCGGCSLEYHLGVAERFLEQAGFDEDDREQVLAIMQQRFERTRIDPFEPPPWRPAAAGTLCEVCGQPFAVHEVDPDFDELTVLCDGTRVRL